MLFFTNNRLLGRGLEGAEYSQHTFFRVVCARHQYHRHLPFRPWLLSIAKNLVRDARRRQHTAQVGTAMLAETERAHRPMSWVEAKLVVSFALTNLNEPTRRLVVAHHGEGLSFGELSTREGVSTTALKVRAHRAYGAMREACRAPAPFVVTQGGAVRQRGTS